MPMILRLCFVLAMTAGSAWAQGVSPSDEMLDRPALSAALAGRGVEFYDGSKAHYGADGGYVYTYTDDGAPFVGTYTFADQGQVCVDFAGGRSRCDTMVRSKGRLTLITKDGTRFPVRQEFVLPQP